MTEIITIVYNGISVSYDEWQNQWRNEETGRRYESLAKAKEAIDRAAKIAGKIQPVPCIKYQESNKGICFVKAAITSFLDENTVWLALSDKNGNKIREKFSERGYGNPDLYLDTPENWSNIEKLYSLWKREREIHDDIKEALSWLKPFDIAGEYRKLAGEGAPA